MQLLTKLTVTFAILFLIVLLRYLFFAGGMYWLCWVKNRERWQYRRIQPKFPPVSMLWSEFRWSLFTVVIFAVSGALALEAWERGHTRVYLDIAEYGWPYFFLSVALLALTHETYFYWTHRWLHHPRLFKRFHGVHHDSVNPSPWASFSFHPVEAVIQAVILPVMVLLIPAHPAAILILLTLMTVLGVINHTGYEFYPKNFATHPVWRYVISATHHQMHHEKFKGNYGLYFTLWDRWLGTEDLGYPRRYAEVVARRSDAVHPKI